MESADDGAEIIAEHDKAEGPTLVILHALQACPLSIMTSVMSPPAALPEQFMSSPDRLIYMANQIGQFFRSQGHDQAVPGIAEHIKKFWDPACASRSSRSWNPAAPASTPTSATRWKR
jgi:hypothetical protein